MKDLFRSAAPAGELGRQATTIVRSNALSIFIRLTAPLLFPIALFAVGSFARSGSQMSSREPCPACWGLAGILIAHLLTAIYLVAKARGHRILFSLVLTLELLVSLWIAFVASMFVTGRFI